MRELVATGIAEVQKGEKMNDTVYRQDAIAKLKERRKIFCKNRLDFTILPDKDKARVDEIDACISTLINLPPAQAELFADADKLERCRFEYINACKIAAHPTPDTSKNDINDAYAVIKALNPIFGDENF